MRLPLICDNYEHLHPIYDSCTKKEDTLDCVIPDICADVCKILDVRGQLLLLSKKAADGKVFLCISVKADVLYEPEGGGEVQHISAVIPADRTLPVTEADSETAVYACAELCSIDARLLNPRKLNLRCEVGLTLRCWNRMEHKICCAADEDSGVCVLQKNAEAYAVTGVKEKYFTVSDSYQIPSELPQNAELISSDSRICVSEVKIVGGKLIFRCEAETCGVFMCRETGRLFSTCFQSAFSQLIEVEAAQEGSAYVSAQLSEVSITEDSDGKGCFNAELSVFAQAVFGESRELKYIADAYCNAKPLESECEAHTLEKLLFSKTAEMTLRGRLPICAELTELCYLEAAAVCVCPENGGISANVLVSGVGKDEDGDYCAPQLRLSDCFTPECSAGQTVQLTSVCVANAEVRSGFEVSVCVSVSYNILCRETISAVSALELSEDCECSCRQRPSVTVLCADRGEDLWSIAKRCGSTVELIRCANTVDGVFSESRRPLLIPKA